MEPHTFRLGRNHDGQPLFVAPPEFRPNADLLPLSSNEGLTHQELWERHFRDLPHGDRRLASWVRDPSHRVQKWVLRAPWIRSVDSPCIAARRRDLSLVRAELAAIDAWLVPIGALVVRESVLVDERAWMECQRHAQTGLDCLARVRGPFQRLCDAWEIPASLGPYRGLVSTPLPTALLEAVVGHPAGDLPARWVLAAALRDRVRKPKEPTPLRWPRAPLLAVVEGALEAAGLREADPGEADPEAYVVKLAVALLDAEAMATRGETAFLALAADDGRDEARRMADELAAQSLARALRGMHG